MKKEKLPSEIIEDFVLLMENANALYTMCKAEVDSYDEKTLDWVHQVENGKLASQRSKIATAFREERLKRREAKDTMLMYEKIQRFYSDQINSGTMKRIKTLLSQQKQTEAYIKDEHKTYKSRRKLSDPD